MASEVVITGRGLVTPIGIGLAENTNSLKSGKSGICLMQEWQELGLESCVAGKVNMDFECEAYDRKQMRFMPDNAKMAAKATCEAIAEAGYTLDTLPGDRMAVITGCGGSGYSDFCKALISFQNTKSTRRISAFSVPRIMPSSAVANLSLIFKITGENYDISCACASGAVAIAQGARLIRSGEYDIVLVGGCEELSWQECLGFIAMRALSHSYSACPEKSSRPFDKQRDGFVLAEAAGMVILESAEHAAARGAKPIFKLSGYALNSNATDMVAPNASAIASVMQAAIRDAGLKPEDIDYVNAHATSTGIGDILEMQGLKELFQPLGLRPMINSTKSQTGHPIGAAGAIEMIFTTLMMEHNFVSGTLNLEEPEDDMDWADLVRTTRENVHIRHAISNSFGFGGTNATLVISEL